MNKEVIYFMNKTPLHVGTGEPSPLDDSIKGAIQRHPITNTPIVPASSLKGALRSHFVLENTPKTQIDKIFGQGSEETNGSAGQYIFSDLNIIAQPVTAIDDVTFKTVFLMKNREKLIKSDASIQDKELTVCDVEISGEIVDLDEKYFENITLHKRLIDNPYGIQECFFVNDITFNLLCNNLVWVRSRNSLLNHKELVNNGISEFDQRIQKRVSPGALWKEEYVIEGAVWEGFIINRINNDKFFSILGDQNGYEFFLGGLETIGCGLMEVL